MGILQFLKVERKKLNKQQQPNQMQQKTTQDNSVSLETSSYLSTCFCILQMFFFSVGICTCFCLWSIKQERVVTRPYTTVYNDGKTFKSAKLSTVFVLGFAQSIVGAVIGLFMLCAEKVIASMCIFYRKKRDITVTKKLSSLSVPAITKITSEKIKKATVTNSNGNNQNNNYNYNYNKEKADTAKNTIKKGTVLTGITSSRNNKMIILRMSAFMGFANAFASSLGYGSMRRLPYPVVLAAKMSKMVPVMLVGFFWYGTRYSWKNCAACAIITFGVMCFYLLNEKEKSQHATKGFDYLSLSASWVGFLMLFINLITDGFMNSTQQVLIKTYNLSSYQLMVLLNFSTVIWLFLVLIALEALHPLSIMFLEMDKTVKLLSDDSLFGYFFVYIDSNIRYFLREVAPLQDLSLTLKFFGQYPEAMYDVIVMSLLNAAGQVFIFSTISSFGMLTFLAVTLLRKAGSVLLSVSIHGHNVAIGQWISLFLVLVGAVWEGLMNVKRNPQHQSSK